MTHEEHRLQRQRRDRVARVKRVLRWMPRRATVHKYPVLRWFGEAARKRSYLWCFRLRAAIPAIYAGCILALLPLYGIQLPMAIALAFLLRANLPILFSAQFITNPLTALPVYFACYQTGRAIFHAFGAETPHLNMAEMKVLMESLQAGNWSYNLHYIGKVWGLTAIGGTIIGTFLASASSALYRLAAYEVTIFNERIRILQRKRTEAVGKAAPPTKGKKVHG